MGMLQASFLAMATTLALSCSFLAHGRLLSHGTGLPCPTSSRLCRKQDVSSAGACFYHLEKYLIQPIHKESCRYHCNLEHRKSIRLQAGNQSSALSTTSDGAEDREAALVEENVRQTFLRLVASLAALEPDFLLKLPNDLKVDIGDAAFALSNGAVTRECGEEVGDALVQLGGAIEKANASAAASSAELLASGAATLPARSSLRAYLGKRLIAAARPLASTSSYGKGELAEIAKAFREAGEAVRAGCEETPNQGAAGPQIRTFKFGSLQVDVTPLKAFAGAGVAAVFGLICWQLASGLQEISAEPSKYANDNALIAAQSLQGLLLSTFYGCTLLSALSTIGLTLLGVELNSKKDG